VRNKEKLRGCLIGGAVGDALGYQIEFEKKIADKEFTKYKNDKGIISDDTQMTLFTANGLLCRETRLCMRGIAMPPEIAIYHAYLDWLETQDKTKRFSQGISWIKHVSELNVQRAPGMTCLEALNSGEMGKLEKPINNSKGCGGVMRVAPIGLYARNPEIAGEMGAKAAAITHGHQLSSISAFVMATMINILTYNDKTIEEALKDSLLLVKKYFKRKDVKTFIKIISLAEKLSKENLKDTIAIKQIGEGWVAEEAFAIAIYSCLKYQDDFKNAIVCAVNHDGDSDSTGSIAGNIMGVYLGYESIPSYYVDNLELKDLICQIADDLSIDVPVDEYSKNNDMNWLEKYVGGIYKN